jgi:hypothetical protein
VHFRRFIPFLLLGTAIAGCQDKLPVCGDPVIPGLRVRYQVVDAATGEDWFAQPGRTVPDSLRLLPTSQGLGQPAVRSGSRVLLGPITTLAGFNNGVITQYLRFNATDVDTIVTRFAFNTVQSDPCGYGPGVNEVAIIYNGRPNTVFQASTAADSLDVSGYFGGRVVQLRKRQ